jgi:uncharacterized glyoxalase superfamily protein PhnB
MRCPTTPAHARSHRCRSVPAASLQDRTRVESRHNQRSDRESGAELTRIGTPDRAMCGGMKPNRSMPSASVIPVLTYPDVREAVAWLCSAFGFQERLRIGDSHRSQLVAGDGAVIVADLTGDRRSPEAGNVTHSVMVRVPDLDSHHARSRAHGARIIMEPTTFQYGERQYGAEDLAGPRWTFSETMADVDPEDWGGELIVEP